MQVPKMCSQKTVGERTKCLPLLSGLAIIFRPSSSRRLLIVPSEKIRCGPRRVANSGQRPWSRRVSVASAEHQYLRTAEWR